MLNAYESFVNFFGSDTNLYVFIFSMYIYSIQTVWSVISCVGITMFDIASCFFQTDYFVFTLFMCIGVVTFYNYFILQIDKDTEVDSDTKKESIDDFTENKEKDVDDSEKQLEDAEIAKNDKATIAEVKEIFRQYGSIFAMVVVIIIFCDTRPNPFDKFKSKLKINK